MADELLIELFDLVGPIVFEVAKQEINLLVGVDEEVRKLQGKLGMIKAMLDDAEERHAVKRRAEKLWLEQIQNQYYEMDDILDTWNTARIRAEIEKEEEKPPYVHFLAVVKEKVCSFVQSLLCCFNLPLRHDVGHKIRKLNEKLDTIPKDKVTRGIDFNRQPDVVPRPTTTSFADVSHIIGRDIYRDDPLRNLLDVDGLEETNSYRVISLVGMGGIGKTTLAQLAYNHPNVQAHFQIRMWICVSDPFDQCKVARAIINEIDPKHPLGDIKLQTLLCEIQKLIKEKKYFLVLDDVWIENSQIWEPFKLALKNGVHGSRILVSTRKQRAAEVMGSVHMINLELLANEDCLSIFNKIAFSNEEQPKYLEDLSKKLAIKCKGLPLAAKTLGSLMQNKRSRDGWNNILDSHMWELEDIENGLLAPLLLSYYELPSTMRRCFSYCAVFTKGYLFSRDQLVLHWMAQGYIESKANMELEVIAEEYFEKLAMRSFFQDFQRDEDSDGKIIGCKMHDIVHDFAQFMTKNEFFEIDGDKKLEIDCQSARHLHLKISEEMQFLESIYSAKNLRTLFLLSRERYYEFEMSFHRFQCLRTLILDCPIKELPNAVENLIHLRCLHMFENVEIKKFPKTFCNLCNLQSLNIENKEYFEKLPQEMSKLINLRHLIFYNTDTYYRKKLILPKGIGKLTGLRTLSIFNIGDKDDGEGGKLGELQNLNQLRGTLRICGMEKMVNVDEAQNAQLEDKKHLRELVLLFETQVFHWCEDKSRMENDVKVLKALRPPPNLQYLQIEGYEGNTIDHNWMMSWTTLKKLQLTCCNYLEHLPSLGQLPFLEVLEIKWLHNVKKVGDEFLGIEDSNRDFIFPNLKSLEFWRLDNWEEWIGMGGTGEEEEEENDNGIVTNPIIIKIMPRLQSLTILCCDRLKSLPDYLLTAPLLKKLKISSSKLLEERYQKWTREDWRKISHISNIKISGEYMKRDGEPQLELDNDPELQGILTIKEMGNMENVDEAQNAQLKDKILLHGLELVFETLDLLEPKEGNSEMEKFLKKREKRMENDVKALNALELPPSLQYLRIREYTGNTIYSNWMRSWTTLKKLQLNHCENLEHLPSLGQLPLLEVLETAWLQNVKKVGGEFLGIEDSKNKEDVDIIFPNLKSLEFVGLTNCEEWIGNGIMPCLQFLKIEACHILKSLPDYLLTAPLLKELEITHSPLLVERYLRGTRDNWCKISRISNIKLGTEYVQREPQCDLETYYDYGASEEDDVSEINEEDDVPEIREEDDVVKGDV
ncbi:hypothetical protein SO802_010975 [Lithocarpus litseifolius]|uniref:Disease resistance protein RGA3 n=1 Tax=Lithocarpus litseifolius TaxID=425828 RepID=A0AAW2DIP8_9ROSI